MHVLTLFVPVLFTLYTLLLEHGGRRSEQDGQGGEVVGVVELGVFRVVDVKKRLLLEHVPGLACVRGVKKGQVARVRERTIKPRLHMSTSRPHGILRMTSGAR